MRENGADIDAATKVTINSFSIKGKFNQEGTLNLATGVWTSSAAAADQTITYQPATAYDVTNVNDKAEADAAKAVTEFMFVPSTAAANYEINIDYDFTTTDANVDGGKVVVNNKIKKTLSGVNFEQGKKIKLYVALGLTSVKLEAEVGDWTDAADQNVWLPVNL